MLNSTTTAGTITTLVFDYADTTNFVPTMDKDQAEGMLDNGEPTDLIYEINQRGRTWHYNGVLSEDEQAALDTALAIADTILTRAQERMEAIVGVEEDADA